MDRCPACGRTLAGLFRAGRSSSSDATHDRAWEVRHVEPAAEPCRLDHAAAMRLFLSVHAPPEEHDLAA